MSDGYLSLLLTLTRPPTRSLITLDLDDGVKVNYGKFGDLLDSVKIVTGGAGDE
jgi:hypothetical protein